MIGFPAESQRWAGTVVLMAAAAVALGGARHYAGGWNDGSRLATVEALVDYHTFAIDDSIFVKVPPRRGAAGPGPYPPEDAILAVHGTGDKLLIEGRYYSDKSPVPALLVACIYRAWQAATGWTARDRPDAFCYAMTVLSSGLAYVAAVLCVFWAGGLVGLPLVRRMVLTASFGMTTVALPYAVHVNNHILLLGVTAGMVPGLVKLAGVNGQGPCRRRWLLGLGSLAGLGYTIDLGVGPVLLVCTLVLVFCRCRSWKSVLLAALAAAPWLGVHHAVNYAVGGTWKPANAVAEYFDWPGSTFTRANITGSWNHAGVGEFAVYAAGLLVSRHGFLAYNLPLFLAVAGAVWLLRRRTPEWPLVLYAVFFCLGVWLAYALTSTNYSGRCCSVRWFVPLLAPAYLVLAVFLRRHPGSWGDFLILSGWGGLVAVMAWLQGPWTGHLVPFFWPIQAAALASWASYGLRKRTASARHLPPPSPEGRGEEAAVAACN